MADQPPDAISVVLRPDADEASRALFGQYMRHPAVIAIAVVTALLIGGFVAGFIALLSKLGLGAFWPLFAFIGAAAIAMLPWRFRVAFRRSLQKRLDARGGDESVTFSSAGIDTKAPHTAAHVDWNIVKGARATPTGLILQIGSHHIYLSRLSFSRGDDYARVLAMLRERLGSKAVLGQIAG